MSTSVLGASIREDEEKDKLAQVLESKIQTLGQEHSKTLDAMNHLAFVLTSRGEHEEAMALLQQTVPIVEKVYGADHPRTIYSLNCLIIVLRRAGRFAEAENALWQILNIKKRSLGEAHPETLDTTESLAWMLYRQNKYEEMLELYPDLNKLDSNTFHLIRDTNRLDAAEIIYQGSLRLKTNILGEEHPETLKSKSELAAWLNGKCRRTEAETMYRQLVTLRTEVLGKDHKDTLKNMNDLADVLSEQGKYHDADQILHDLIPLQESSLGKGSLEELRSMDVLAKVLLQSGKLGAAEEILRELAALKSQLRGKEHPETLETLEDLAIVASEQEQYAEAEKMFRQLANLRLKPLGKDDPTVLTTLSYLAVMLQKQENYDEAEKVLYKQHLSTGEGLLNEGPEMGLGGDELFTYQPLTSPKSTRIIKIYPSRYKTAALVCELIEEVLRDDNPPSYAAISYTWGSQIPSKRIFCHGKTLLVTENCKAIMRRFRRADKISYLWIDAICINQCIVEERNDQVAMMEDIYRLAEVVAIWLGAATDLTKEAFRYFENLAEDHCEPTFYFNDEQGVEN